MTNTERTNDPEPLEGLSGEQSVKQARQLLAQYYGYCYGRLSVDETVRELLTGASWMLVDALGPTAAREWLQAYGYRALHQPIITTTDNRPWQ